MAGPMSPIQPDQQDILDTLLNMQVDPQMLAQNNEVDPLQAAMYPEQQVPVAQLLPSLVKERQSVSFTAPPKSLVSQETNDILNQRSTPVLDQQKQALQDYQNQIKKFSEEKSGVNPLVAAMMGASDLLGGTNYTSSYLIPQHSKDEAKQKQALEMQQNYQKAVNDLAQRDLALRNQQFQNVKEQSKEDWQRSYQQQLLDLKKKEVSAKPERNVGLDAANRDFAKEYSGYEKDMPEVASNLQLLQEARDKLAQNPDFTGTAGSRLPDYVRSQTYPDAVATKQQVQQAIQGTLRTTLGAAFTKKEGEDLLNRTWDDKLPAEENLKKLDAAISKIQSKVSSINDKISYFQGNNFSLEGYNQKLAGPTGDTKVYNGITYKKQGDQWVRVK